MLHVWRHVYDVLIANLAVKVAMSTTMELESRRRNETGGSQVSSDRAGGEYCAEGTNWEESADKSVEWSGEETERLATDEEAETVGGTEGVSKTWTVMARV